MDINLVLDSDNSGWILGKIARRLRDNLIELGHVATLTTAARKGSDVNHFMNYNMVTRTGGICSTMITHLDDYYKLSHVRRLLKSEVLDYAICMSPHMATTLARIGCDPTRLRWVLPAVDELPPIRHIRIGLSGRVHEDGRKNEKWLIDVARTADLRPFVFSLFGRGWHPLANALRAAGAQTSIVEETEDFDSDYAKIIESLQFVDYWMYLGLDEGAMGVLDASLAGVPLIATPQGFHLNLPNGIRYPVGSAEDLQGVLHDIGRPLVELQDLGEAWSWRRYALDHLAVWEAKDRHEPVMVVDDNSDDSILGVSRGSMMRRSFSLRRIRSAIARTSLGRRIRSVFFRSKVNKRKERADDLSLDTSERAGSMRTTKFED